MWRCRHRCSLPDAGALDGAPTGGSATTRAPQWLTTLPVPGRARDPGTGQRGCCAGKERNVGHRLTGDASAMRPMLRIAWYRFRATLGHRWGGYLVVVLLVGLVGGVAMASIAAARRTQSSFSVFLASTNPSDLSVPTFGASASGSYSAALTTEIARLREVKHVEAWISVNAAPLARTELPSLTTSSRSAQPQRQRPLLQPRSRGVTRGRMADPVGPMSS